MVNHGVSSGALFLLVGYIYERRHTYQISALKGLQKSRPILAAIFTVVMLSSIGVPGLNGFVGEFLILIGSFLTYRWWVVVADGRRDPRRRVPALVLPAGLPRRARRGRTRTFTRPQLRERAGAVACSSPSSWAWASTRSRSSTGSSRR